MKSFSFTLKQLKIIQTIKRKKEVNIKLGAKNLYLSQPALSSQIKKLEYNIYSKILLRKKKQIYFTPEGELILDYANKVLKLCEEADQAMLYLKKLKKFNLRIGSNKIIGEYISIKLLDLFCKRYSYANAQLQIGSTKSISWDLINGKIDIGIVYNDEVPKKLYNSLYITPYVKEKIILIVPKPYQKEFINNINKANLYGLNFITIKSYLQERELIDNILKKVNINPKNFKKKLELNSIEAMKYAVEAGLGVSFLPNILVKEELYSKRLYSLLIKSINTRNQLILIVNLKNNESYLSEQFYNYCFALLKPTFYNKFLNLES